MSEHRSPFCPCSMCRQTGHLVQPVTSMIPPVSRQFGKYRLKDENGRSPLGQPESPAVMFLGFMRTAPSCWCLRALELPPALGPKDASSARTIRQPASLSSSDTPSVALQPRYTPSLLSVHEAGCAAHLRRNHDMESLDRHRRQSQHGFGAVRPDLWLPGAVPMGCAAEVAFLDWPRIAVADWVHLVGATLLVQDLFNRGLFSHAVLPRGTCWHICTRAREAKRRRFSETALSSCLSLLLAHVTRPGASIKQRLSVLP